MKLTKCNVSDKVIEYGEVSFGDGTGEGIIIKTLKHKENIPNTKIPYKRYDLQQYLEENLETIIANHLETSKELYWRKSFEYIQNELDVNRDYSFYIRTIEKELNRNLEDDEKYYAIDMFVAGVISDFYTD